ncbi:efflux RND transporter periplasmic adaptor subunit [Oceanobacter kriegii]|uniref:efflux RND transporter periplasmic adaptor subunit n=1 Tax=Oceanobacter kriegii TaxID=64972 RepID=UPI000405A75F|nr:HlyD family efflux transporter periplasmic adaptor subunit [Oceanobacter kriegii]
MKHVLALLMLLVPLAVQADRVLQDGGLVEPLRPYLYDFEQQRNPFVGNVTRGVLRSTRSSTLSAQINSQVLNVPYREGKPFSKGDLLVVFDCALPEARLKAATEAAEVLRNRMLISQELANFQSIGSYELLEAESAYRQGISEQEALQIQANHCEVRAPYSGRVQKWLIMPYELAAPNQPLIEIVDTRRLEIELIIDSVRLPDVLKSPEFEFTVDETGTVLKGKVVRSLPEVDPISKTVKVIGRIQGAFASTELPGMSGTATFDLQETAALRQPPAAGE